MTRKDYVAIAAAIKSRADLYGKVQHSELFRGELFQIACEIAEVMGRDNPRFDRERFLKACGIEA